METHRIETKRELTPDLDLEKEVIAFLNTPEGGLIFIGIDKTGTSVGVADVDGDMLKIKDRIKHNITPSAMGLFDVLAEESGGVICIKIIVAGGSEKPYFKKKYGMTEKGCFLRVGTAAEPMPTSMIERLFASRTRNSIGKIKAHASPSASNNSASTMRKRANASTSSSNEISSSSPKTATSITPPISWPTKTISPSRSPNTEAWIA